MSTPDFYRHALAYDIAFGDRDFARECDFLAWCLHEHGKLEYTGKHEPSFIELACGPAQHAREFALREWRSIGLDMSADMLNYARDRSLQQSVNLETVCADMCDFRLAQPVALAANMMESITHLVTNDQVVKHLRAVARNLLPGGIYVIEMAHPSAIWRDCLPNMWSSKRDGIVVDFLFGLEDDPYDWITQQWTVTARLTISEAGLPQRVYEEHNNHRWYLPQEFSALVDLAGVFESWWWYGDMRLPPPALENDQDAERMIFVLRSPQQTS